MSNGNASLQPSVKHISRNFGLYGFGTEKSAIIQSAKELLENSIDACAMTSITANTNEKAICVCIKSASNSGEIIILEVSDGGCGIANAESVLNCFSTTKDGDNIRSSGRFGIGLSTCLIYSFLSTHIPMRIVSKCSIEQAATIADYSLDTVGSPICIQQRSLSANISSGTKISLALPLSRDDSIVVLPSVLESLLDLVKRLCTHPAHSIAIDLVIDTVDYKRSCHLIATDPYIAVAAQSSEHILCSQFKRNLYKTSSLHFTSLEEASKCASGEAERAGIKVTAILVLSTQESSHDTSSSGNQVDVGLVNQCDAPLQDAVLPIYLWRYVNHVPLLGHGDDELSCCTATALRSLRWAEYGFKLTPTTAESESVSISVVHDHHTHQTQTLRWEAKALRPEAIARLQAKKINLLIAIDVVSTNIPFANMCKSSLRSDHPFLSKLITDAICIALEQLEGSNINAALFMPKKEYKKGLIHSKFIPSIARSLTQIIKHSKSAKYIRSVHETIGLRATATHQEGGNAVEGREDVEGEEKEEDEGILFNQDVMRMRLTTLLEDVIG